MSRIKQVETENATEEQKVLFDQINGAFGVVPNMFRTIGNSAAALESMWTSFGALGKGKLGAKLGEQIAVRVAELNRCGYCLAAHTMLGQNAGASEQELAQAQTGKSSDPRTQAALEFSTKLVNNRGNVSKEDVDAVRNAGFSEEEVAEILAHVALNLSLIHI